MHINIYTIYIYIFTFILIDIHFFVLYTNNKRRDQQRVSDYIKTVSQLADVPLLVFLYMHTYIYICVYIYVYIYILYYIYIYTYSFMDIQ